MKSHDRDRLARRRRGAVGLITIIFAMFVMIGLTAIAVDVGYMMRTRTQLQAASDAATLSGGTELIASPTETPWRSLNSRLEAPASLQITLFEELDD